MAAKAGEAKPAGEKAGKPAKGEKDDRAGKPEPAEKAGKPEQAEKPEKPVERKKLTKAEKQAQHMERLRKTAVACVAGILAGILSFFIDTRGTTAGTALGILFLLAAIVFQKYVFFALRMDYLKLTAKDWFFQGFMTFSFWFITWTILLSSR